jgi:hypothetical protein
MYLYMMQGVFGAALLAGLAAAAPKADFGGHDHDGGAGKKCELVRSLQATSAECFLEPECENRCTTDSRQVRPFLNKKKTQQNCLLTIILTSS